MSCHDKPTENNAVKPVMISRPGHPFLGAIAGFGGAKKLRSTKIINQASIRYKYKLNEPMKKSKFIERISVTLNAAETKIQSLKCYCRTMEKSCAYLSEYFAEENNSQHIFKMLLQFGRDIERSTSVVFKSLPVSKRIFIVEVGSIVVTRFGAGILEAARLSDDVHVVRLPFGRVYAPRTAIAQPGKLVETPFGAGKIVELRARGSQCLVELPYGVGAFESNAIRVVDQYMRTDTWTSVNAVVVTKFGSGKVLGHRREERKYIIQLSECKAYLDSKSIADVGDFVCIKLIGCTGKLLDRTVSDQLQGIYNILIEGETHRYEAENLVLCAAPQFRKLPYIAGRKGDILLTRYGEAMLIGGNTCNGIHSVDLKWGHGYLQGDCFIRKDQNVQTPVGIGKIQYYRRLQHDYCVILDLSPTSYGFFQPNSMRTWLTKTSMPKVHTSHHVHVPMFKTLLATQYSPGSLVGIHNREGINYFEVLHPWGHSLLQESSIG